MNQSSTLMNQLSELEARCNRYEEALREQLDMWDTVLRYLPNPARIAFIKRHDPLGKVFHVLYREAPKQNGEVQPDILENSRHPSRGGCTTIDLDSES